MVIDAAQYSPGALSPFTKIFFNPGECHALLKIPHNASDDDIHMLFFHVIL